ncbi:hypothetical protein [Streptacidiphilus melanogenes]|uniref:hypothetical protein n=1 Tax=Streptacidiphilus melanogenes TaxID=411235 RepID=UPI00126A6BB6|nr:hypothetical protein [Streptacidiphilus melanogenes]
MPNQHKNRHRSIVSPDLVPSRALDTQAPPGGQQAVPDAIERLPETELAWLASLAMTRATSSQAQDLRQAFKCARGQRESTADGFRRVVQRAFELRPPLLRDQDLSG